VEWGAHQYLFVVTPSTRSDEQLGCVTASSPSPRSVTSFTDRHHVQNLNKRWQSRPCPSHMMHARTISVKKFRGKIVVCYCLQIKYDSLKVSLLNEQHKCEANKWCYVIDWLTPQHHDILWESNFISDLKAWQFFLSFFLSFFLPFFRSSFPLIPFIPLSH